MNNVFVLKGLCLNIEPVFGDNEVVISAFDLDLLLLADGCILEGIGAGCLLLLFHDKKFGK
jgi:hypothetical protein